MMPAHDRKAVSNKLPSSQMEPTAFEATSQSSTSSHTLGSAVKDNTQGRVVVTWLQSNCFTSESFVSTRLYVLPVPALTFTVRRDGYPAMSEDTKAYYGGWDHIVEPHASMLMEVGCLGEMAKLLLREAGRLQLCSRQVTEPAAGAMYTWTISEFDRPTHSTVVSRSLSC